VTKRRKKGENKINNYLGSIAAMKLREGYKGNMLTHVADLRKVKA